MFVNKKTILAVLVFATSSLAANATDDGSLKYSHSLMYLTCEAGACTPGTSTHFHSMKVYYKYEADIPPHSEARLYWNNNVPADIPAGKDIAYTVAGECPAGSLETHLSAKWFLSDFKPVTAIATDCAGLTYTYSVHPFDF